MVSLCFVVIMLLMTEGDGEIELRLPLAAWRLAPPLGPVKSWRTGIDFLKKK